MTHQAMHLQLRRGVKSQQKERQRISACNLRRWEEEDSSKTDEETKHHQ